MKKYLKTSLFLAIVFCSSTFGMRAQAMDSGIIIDKRNNPPLLPGRIQSYQATCNVASSRYLQLRDAYEAEAKFCSTVDKAKDDLKQFQLAKLTVDFACSNLNDRSPECSQHIFFVSDLLQKGIDQSQHTINEQNTTCDSHRPQIDQLKTQYDASIGLLCNTCSYDEMMNMGIVTNGLSNFCPNHLL